MLAAGARRELQLSLLGSSLRYKTPLPDDFGNTVQFLCLHQPRFDEVRLVRFVEWLRQSYQILSYSDAIERTKSGNINERYLAISYDDGLHSHYAAAQVLARTGVSACFFVSPGVLCEPPKIDPDSYCKQRLFIHPQRVMSWDELESLREMGHEVGSHSLTHHDLNSIEYHRAVDEIEQSKRYIESRLGVCDHFAWPYGQQSSINDALIKVTLDAGYRSIASAIPGMYLPGKSHYNSALWVPRVPLECHWRKINLRARLRQCEHRGGL